MNKTAILKQKNTIEISMVDQYRSSLALLAKSLRFGIEEEIHKAAALYNVKAFNLWRVECDSYQQFITSLRISDTSAKRYFRIGRGFAKNLQQQDATSIFLTEAHLEQYSKLLASGNGKITLRGLDAVSKDVTLLRRYLQGEISDDQLLYSSKAVQLPLPERSEETESASEIKSLKTATIITNTSATNETLSLELWKRIEARIDILPSDISNELERYGKYLTEWYPDASQILQETITQRFRALCEKLTVTMQALSAIHQGDLEEAHSILND